jgi:hypothetical protein
MKVWVPIIDAVALANGDGVDPWAICLVVDR